MLRMITIRIAMSIPLVLIVTALTFVLMSLLPGDAATTILGTNATPQSIEQLNAQLGLDKPIWQQYFSWLGRVLHGDLGTSIFNKESVSEILNKRIVVTLSLLLGAMLVAVVPGQGTLRCRRLVRHNQA